MNICMFNVVRVVKYNLNASSVGDGKARKVLTAATELRSQLVPELTHSGSDHLSVPCPSLHLPSSPVLSLSPYCLL